MKFAALLLNQNLIMLFYLIIGYFLMRKKLVGLQGSADIARLLLYIVMPMAILNSYLTDFTPEKCKALIFSFIAAALALFLSILISRLFFSSNHPVERFGTAFSNAGFIGIPLVQMTLGNEAVFYVSSFVALLNILQWTYGVLLLTKDRKCLSFQKIRTNPIVLSFLGGLILFFLPISLPEILNGPIRTLASMNGPLAMIVLGTYLAQIPLKSLWTDRIAYKCSFVRLIVIPLLTILLLLIFPSEFHTLKLTVLIAASAPVGSNVAIFAQLYDQDYLSAVREICLSTLLCIVTMPLLIGIADCIL